MFHMAGDSDLFASEEKMSFLPLYEAKFIWHFDHRFSTYANATTENINEGNLPQLTPESHADPQHRILTRYWVPAEEIALRLSGNSSRNWLIGFRDIASATNERTGIFSVIPKVGTGHTLPFILFSANVQADLVACILSTLNSLTLDYILRQKIGGVHLTFTILNQLPILPPSTFSEADIAFIVPRVLELVYTAWDMRPFAEDLWAEAEEPLCAEILRRNAECNTGAPAELFAPRDGFVLPFRWSDERRALIRAELDARIARLYGLTRDELRYILDPADIYGPDFPGETFRVLKEKETKLYGEYRTRRLVLEAWDREISG